jgi:hypothetical protein
MKFETRITLTREELNKYVADGRKAEGKPLHDDEVLTIVLEDSAPAAPGLKRLSLALAHTEIAFKFLCS